MRNCKEDRLYFSDMHDEKTWTSDDYNMAYLVAIPQRFWSIKDWKLCNELLKKIGGFLIR